MSLIQNFDWSIFKKWLLKNVSDLESMNTLWQHLEEHFWMKELYYTFCHFELFEALHNSCCHSRQLQTGSLITKSMSRDLCGCVWERDFGRVKNDDSGVLEPKRVRFDSFLHYCVYLFESMRLTVMIYRFWCQLLLKYLFLPSVHCNNLKWDYRHPVSAITVSLYSTIIVSFSCRSLKKFGSLNDCVCHACVRDHTNVLGIVPMLAYVLHK